MEKYMWGRKMNEKMRGINIQEKASMCGKCKMWLVMVVFALISTAMLSSVKIHAASAEENQMADVETNHVTAVENTQEQIQSRTYKHPQHADHQRIQKTAVLQDIFVGHRCKIHRPKHNTSGFYGAACRKGNRKYIDNRQQTHQGQKRQNENIDPCEGIHARRLFLFHVCLLKKLCNHRTSLPFYNQGK